MLRKIIFTETQKQNIINLHLKEKMTIKDISFKYNYNLETIRKRLISWNIKIQHYRKINTLKQFFKKLRKIHSDKYDYSLVEYKNMFKKVKIICKKHDNIKTKFCKENSIKLLRIPYWDFNNINNILNKINISE